MRLVKQMFSTDLPGLLVDLAPALGQPISQGSQEEKVRPPHADF